MEFQYKNVLIWGYGISGRAVEKVLIDIGVDYTILDEGEKIRGGGFIDRISKKEIVEYDLIVLSPAVDINRKEIIYAKSCGIEVVSEIEFGYMFLYHKTKVIAVTGTNGKTTTVDLIYNMLKAAGKDVAELGNIGKPFSEVYGKKYDYVVVELSSFQLDMCKNFKADIAVLLNIAPDHLDRHGNFENYVKAKLKIFNNQQKSDCAIINADDSILCGVKNLIAKKIAFSTTDPKAKYSCINSVIYKSNKCVLDFLNYNIANVFNSDILAMYIVSDILGIELEIVGKVLQYYKFLSHRCEFVTEIQNIKYYNDSKATNIHAVKFCVDTIKEDNILLMLGGRNKELDFKEFVANLSSKVTKIIAFGEYGKKIYNLRKYNRNIEMIYFKNLHKAMANIDNYLDGISCVLLSPACASFDEFNSYMDRGDFFKKSVYDMKVRYDKKQAN